MRRSRSSFPYCIQLLTKSIMPVVLALIWSRTVAAQTWTWSIEAVDTSARFTSLAVDHQGNVHLSYADGDARNLRYAFRQADTSRWFTMTVDSQLNEFSTHLTLDGDDRPHICYTPRMLKYAYWDGKDWKILRVQPRGQIEFTCSVAIASDGTPSLAWYEKNGADGLDHLHLKYATFKDGTWLARTVDSEGESGKWSSMILDASGNATIVYSRYPNCALKLAQWDGKNWRIMVVDPYSDDRNRGMGNSLVRDSQGNLQVSYYDDEGLRYAIEHDGHWAIQTVDAVSPIGGWQGLWSSMVLDRHGFPHISYDDSGMLKHAFWDGTRWHVQLIARSGGDAVRYSSIGIGSDDTIYISYRDPTDGSLQVARGRLTVAPQQAAAAAPSAKKN